MIRIFTKWYLKLSIPKIFDADDFKLGFINNIRAIAEINLKANANVSKFFPDIQPGWKLPTPSLTEERVRGLHRI